MITSTTPVDMENEVNPTSSPYYLRIFGEWLHVEGVTPGVDVDTERPASRMISVDGVAWEERPARGPRTWSLSFEWATERTMNALRVAAHFPADVWLLDRSMAVVNMLDMPDCLGSGSLLLTNGMPLPRFVAPRAATTMVRRGVATFAALWTDAAEGAPVGTVEWPGGSASLTAPAGTSAQRVVVPPFTPDVDGPLVFTAAAGTTGMQVTEDWLPNEWMGGRRTPCRVSIDDPGQTLNRMNENAQGLSNYSVEIREVG